MTQIEIDGSEIEKLLKQFPQYEDIIADEMQQAMTGSLELFKNEVVGRTPVGATGQARQSINSLPRGRPPNFEGQVVMTVLYGLPLEHGRQPGKPPPPIAPIQLWVERKLGLSGEEAEQAAFLIARAIGRRGTQGAKMFEQGFEAGKPAVEKLWERVPGQAADRIERKINQI